MEKQEAKGARAVEAGSKPAGGGGVVQGEKLVPSLFCFSFTYHPKLQFDANSIVADGPPAPAPRTAHAPGSATDGGVCPVLHPIICLKF